MAGELRHETSRRDDRPTRGKHDARQLCRHRQQHPTVWDGQRTDLHVEKPRHSVMFICCVGRTANRSTR